MSSHESWGGNPGLEQVNECPHVVVDRASSTPTALALVQVELFIGDGTRLVSSDHGLPMNSGGRAPRLVRGAVRGLDQRESDH